MLIVDDGICVLAAGERTFDYSLITSKQNAYVARHERTYCFLREDLDQLSRYATDVEYQQLMAPHHTSDRANTAQASPLDQRLEEHFANVYGADSVRYHHPQLIGRQRYRTQLAKQNSCQRAGIRLFRFSTEDCRFAERLEDDIMSFFGQSANDFVNAGMVVDRPFELYEHQEGVLDEIAERRTRGIRSFLALLPTASGKSRIVEEDLARFAPTRSDFHALIAAPNSTIVDDWTTRLRTSLPHLVERILVCTYAYLTRHYFSFAPDRFNYVMVDEAHHAVAPALKQAIQYFDSDFLVGLTATDQRPDKKRLEDVFDSYRVTSR